MKSPLIQTRGAVQHAVQIAEVTQALLVLRKQS